MKFDFSGYATKSDIRCSDGRIIERDAFVKNDGEKVPLVWQHSRNSPDNILGHAVLENRKDGVYAYCSFNDSEKAKNARVSVEHGDITKMSIYANHLVETNQIVHQGVIREVSLVVAGANPGATIENVNIVHSDGDVDVMEDEAIITADSFIEHSDKSNLAHAGEEEDAKTKPTKPAEDATESNSEETIEDIINTMDDKQKNVLMYLVEQAAGEDKDDMEDDSVEQSDEDDNDKDISHMERNVFEAYGDEAKQGGTSLSHADQSEIFRKAKNYGTLSAAMEEYALEHSLSNVEMLFPEFKLQDGLQTFDRRIEWVDKVLGGVRSIPVGRVRTLVADLTPEEARAKGYVKGNLKKEQVIGFLKRTTEPTTIYKKQGIDRDDLLDITDFDVAAFYRSELGTKLRELLAECILFGDGRSVADEDHVPTDKIRPIAYDNDFYAPKVTIDSNAKPADTIDQIIRARANYRGSGTPTLFTSVGFLTDMLLLKDLNGRRIYSTKAELASALMVSDIVEIERLEDHPTIVAIVVNLADYTLGTDKGGEATTFEDFDIDYNKQKFLIETRASGALHTPKAAIVINRTQGTEAKPQSPSFNSDTNTILIPTTEGVEYTVDGETKTGNVVIKKDAQVDASAKPGFYIPANTNTSWTFVYSDKG